MFSTIFGGVKVLQFHTGNIRSRNGAEQSGIQLKMSGNGTPSDREQVVLAGFHSG